MILQLEHSIFVPLQDSNMNVVVSILYLCKHGAVDRHPTLFRTHTHMCLSHVMNQSTAVAPKSEPVKNPTVPLPSTTQATSSDPIVQAVPQPGASNTIFQAVPRQQTKASNTTPQASPQQQPKASVPPSQQQARASDSTAQSVPVVSDSTTQGVCQQQPRLLDPILQASLQATLPPLHVSFSNTFMSLYMINEASSYSTVTLQTSKCTSTLETRRTW